MPKCIPTILLLLPYFYVHHDSPTDSRQPAMSQCLGGQTVGLAVCWLAASGSPRFIIMHEDINRAV